MIKLGLLTHQNFNCWFSLHFHGANSSVTKILLKQRLGRLALCVEHLPSLTHPFIYQHHFKIYFSKFSTVLWEFLRTKFSSIGTPHWLKNKHTNKIDTVKLKKEMFPFNWPPLLICCCNWIDAVDWLMVPTFKILQTS